MKTEPTYVRMPKDLRDSIQKRADDEGRSLSNMIVRMLRVYVDNDGKGEVGA